MGGTVLTHRSKQHALEAAETSSSNHEELGLLAGLHQRP